PDEECGFESHRPDTPRALRHGWRLPCSPNPSGWKGLQMLLLDTSSTAPPVRRARLARHDEGAIAPSIYGVSKKIEVEIAWREHAKHTDLRGSADQPTA